VIRIRFFRTGKQASAVLFLVAMAAGCATAPDTGPTSSDPFLLPEFSPARVGPMLAHFKTTVHSQAGKRNFRQIVAAEPPDRIRLEIFGPFGHPRLILAVRENVAVGIFPRDGVYFLESDSAAVFRELLGVEIDAAALVPILTGDVLYRDDRTRIGVPQPGPDGWRLQVRQEDSGLEYDLVLETGTRRIAAAGLTPAGATERPVLQVRYRRWRQRNGRELATRLEVEVPAAGIRISNVLQKEEPGGVDFSDRLFRPPVPEHFRRIEVEDLAADAPWLARQD
jgi:hypothetical protein